jgi:hypothetical protein
MDRKAIPVRVLREEFVVEQLARLQAGDIPTEGGGSRHVPNGINYKSEFFYHVFLLVPVLKELDGLRYFAPHPPTDCTPET